MKAFFRFLVFLLAYNLYADNSADFIIENCDELESVIKVDGYPIVYQEFRISLVGNVATASSYYTANYGLDFNEPATWLCRVGNELAPLDKLAKIATAQAIRAKAIQILAAKHECGSVIDFNVLIPDFQSYIKNRAIAQARGVPTYGPNNLNLGQYYQLKMDELSFALRDVLNAKSGEAEALQPMLNDSIFENYIQDVVDNMAVEYDHERIIIIVMNYLGISPDSIQISPSSDKRAPLGRYEVANE